MTSARRGKAVDAAKGDLCYDAGTFQQHTGNAKQTEEFLRRAKVTVTAGRSLEMFMRGMPYTQATQTSETRTETSSIVAEALAKHAASRPPKGPTKLLTVTPTMRKMGKPNRQRRRTV